MIRLVLINLVVFVCLILGVEFIYGVLLAEKQPSGPPIVEENSENYIIVDSLLGFKPKASVKTEVKKRKGDEIIYQATYEFDEHGRRVVPGGNTTTADKHAVFLGDSNVFGEGLNIEETLPFLFAEKFQQFRVYNYAFRGYGPGQALALAESDRLSQELDEDRGVVFYFFRASLAARLLGTLALFRYSPGWDPYYEWNGEKLVRNKTFRESRHYWTKLKQFVARSKIFNYLDRDFPDSYSASNFTKLCAAFVQMEAGVRKQLPRSRLVVVLQIKKSRRDKLEKVMSCLEKNNIAFVDISRAVAKDSEKWKLHPLDSHFNREANKASFNELAKTLPKKGLLSL